MARPTGLRAWIVVFLKGVCMGSADTVPGVSGGTIAVILGIYERLIGALTAIDPRVLGEFRAVHTTEGRARIGRELLRMDVPFLLVLGAGVVGAAATIATLMHTAVVEHPVPTYAFFFGLIAASAVVLFQYVHSGTPRRIAVAGIGFTSALAITDPGLAGSAPHSLPVLFVAGTIAISALILPGISGAFLLLLLGQYTYVSGLPSALAGGLIEFVTEGDGTTFLGAVVPMGTFAIGALVGLFSIAHVVEAALERYREATLTFLVSLMVGSLRLPASAVLDGVVGVTPGRALRVVIGAAAWPATTDTTGLTLATAATVFVPLVAGVVAVLALDRYTDDLQY